MAATLSRPLVAIAGRRIAPGKVKGWPGGAGGVPAAYLDAVRRAGGREALLVPDRIEADEAAAMVRRFDAMLLIGGGDVDPSRYGEDRTDRIYGVDAERDDFEVALARAARDAGTPVLAICRGAQVVNVAFGGTLHQDLAASADGVDHGSPTAGAHRTHAVSLERGSQVAAAMAVERAECQSHHHQAVAKLGEGLIPTGWADDGIVEALEHEDGWLLGVQWHPEMSCATDPVQQRLFDALVERARSR